MSEELEGEVEEMCNASVWFYREAVDNGRAEGIEIQTVRSIKSLMHTSNFSAAKAMDMLQVPYEDRNKYLDMLASEK